MQGDAQQLPFEDASFDAATVGFGVRNLDDLERGLAELRRVLRPGGRVAILEITKPSGLLAPFYRLWFDGFVPLLGRILPGGSAYTYLPASVRRFPGPDELAGLLRGAGFEDVRWRTFAGGIVALHIGDRRMSLATFATRLASTRTSTSSRSAWPGRSSRTRDSSPRSVAKRSRPAASACGRCWSSSPRRPTRPRSRPARRSSSSTWRRSSTTI